MWRLNKKRPWIKLWEKKQLKIHNIVIKFNCWWAWTKAFQVKFQQQAVLVSTILPIFVNSHSSHIFFSTELFSPHSLFLLNILIIYLLPCFAPLYLVSQQISPKLTTDVPFQQKRICRKMELAITPQLVALYTPGLDASSLYNCVCFSTSMRLWCNFFRALYCALTPCSSWTFW